VIALKAGVGLGLLKLQTWIAVQIADSVWGQVVVTSCNDSEHKGHAIAGEDKDPHYTGRAVDLRLNDRPVGNARALAVDKLVQALGPAYRVIHENVGTDAEHAHVQYEGPL